MKLSSRKELLKESELTLKSIKKSLNEDFDGKEWRSNFHNAVKQWITTEGQKFDSDVMNLYTSLLEDAKNKFKPICDELIGKKYSEIAKRTFSSSPSPNEAKIIKAEISLYLDINGEQAGFVTYSGGRRAFRSLPWVTIKLKLSDGSEQQVQAYKDKYNDIFLI